MQELLWGCTNRLRLDFIDEAISNADEAIIEQLANDQLVKLLAILQAHFGSVHLGEEENNFSGSCKKRKKMDGEGEAPVNHRSNTEIQSD